MYSGEWTPVFKSSRLKITNPQYELVTLAQQLGPDPSLENRLKSIRYLMIDRDGLWRKLPYDYFTQDNVYNDNPNQGGLKRYYKLLSDEVVDSAPFQKILTNFSEHFPQKAGAIVLCQIQTTTDWGATGDITGQGIHTDGAEEAMIVCLERKNVHPKSAKNALYEDVAGDRVVMRPRALQAAEAIFWKDNEIYHAVSHIAPLCMEDGPAIRTVMLLHADSSYLIDGRKNERNKLPGRDITVGKINCRSLEAQ